jgi:hypothetical protein
MSDPDSIYCNARKQSGGFDPSNREKTDPGEWAGEGYCKTETGGGRCRMHGRNAGRPPMHGLQSALREDLRQFVEEAASMDSPGDLKGELAVLRGLLFNWLQDTEDLDKDAIEAAHKLLSEIRRTSDTIHKQMTRERLTREEEQELFDTFAAILRKYVPESDRTDALDELAAATSGGSRAIESGAS